MTESESTPTFDVWSRDDADFPECLRTAPHTPTRLWTRGDHRALNVAAVAVIGTRRASDYGRSVARKIAQAIAHAGACVVSGLAAGIDAAAHQGALDAHGRTCAVLGTGIDVVFPSVNAALHARIAQAGLLLSQFPPGTDPFKYNFPKRNSVIAALARAVIVVEAPEKSGALITAHAAQKLDRTIAVVTGPIDRPSCAGSNALLHEPGVLPITSIDDAVGLIGARLAATDPPPNLSDAAAKVWDALAAGPVSIDDLTVRAHLPTTSCLQAITDLEMARAIAFDPGGQVRRL